MPSLLETHGPPDEFHAAFQEMAERFDATHRRGLWLRVKLNDPLTFASIQKIEAEIVTLWEVAEANPADEPALLEQFKAKLAEYETLWKQAAEMDEAVEGTENAT